MRASFSRGSSKRFSDACGSIVPPPGNKDYARQSWQEKKDSPKPDICQICNPLKYHQTAGHKRDHYDDQNSDLRSYQFIRLDHHPASAPKSLKSLVRGIKVSHRKFTDFILTYP